ncbi:MULTISPECIES: thioesterase II family protein [unclassified Streptomyces]|uniref:thioesterase II family protein n=1 Tax=unclassified Streptomyces TaxID=2593676 RepID=UPI00073BB1EF|nr:alpha/beta fold hydrolase [Streptomyces sp. AVP053U2]ODA74776.1 Phenyloxazoline synthase MbtB [Streptomyces sp. AVP053U2]
MTGTDTRSDVWIRQYRPAHPTAPQLICLPHAGGSATFYHPVATSLAPRCDVLAVQYPGRQDRRAEKPLEDIDELANQLFPVLRARVHQPVALFGHSMGATLAFELARRFESTGVPLEALFVSARPAPSRQRTGGTVHLLSDEQLVAELRTLDGTAKQVFNDEELVRMALPAVRGDYKAAETYRYRPGPKLRCPIHALIGDNDPLVTPVEAQAWSEHTNGPFTLDTFAGGHFYLLEHRATVLSIIAEYLRTSSRTPGVKCAQVKHLS